MGIDARLVFNDDRIERLAVAILGARDELFSSKVNNVGCSFHFVSSIGFKVRTLGFSPAFSSVTRFGWISVTVVFVSSVSPILTMYVVPAVVLWSIACTPVCSSLGVSVPNKR